MEPPEIFIEWWAEFVSSNVALASLSNVNRSWRRIVIRVLLEQAQREKDVSLLLLPSMLRAILTKNNATQHDKDTFCAAWFHPAGIQIQSLQAAGDAWEHEGESEILFAPSGVPFYAGSEDERPRGRALRRPEGPLCSHEWQGYRDPVDVLEPFGYAPYFVEEIMSQAKNLVAETKTNGNSTHEGTNDVSSTLTTPQRLDVKATIAVRGATLARPEGYCLCWDSSDAAAAASQANDSWKAESQDGFLRSVMMRKRRRQMLQQEVLPRVVLSSKHKNPLNLEIKSKQQPCLQFLNSSGNNAVRLFTPRFECGPLEGPITLFLVGIATEDGCFVSGLKRRCELGHMHPLNLRDAMIDMSPVCIATDYRRPNQSTSPSESMVAGKSRASLSGRSDDTEDSGADSDDSSCAISMSREQDAHCKCVFNEVTMQSWEEDSDDDEPKEECIYRGHRGPGLWHCYVCVFDKEDSIIRIDGVPETLEKGCCQVSPPAAILDGLTIGSDHCFDMSLGLGDASVEEGEGAISELAVFKGRLPDSDIEQLENYFMQKHGINKPKPSEQAMLVRQDEWKRQGRALIAQPPPWSMRVSGGIPLPMMARDRDVSWHRVNAVTGKQVSVSRIGSRFSTGSSDW
jgi:hypothetical protein